MIDLSVITRVESCADCGACCFEQGAPPDYVALRLNPHLADDPSFTEDVLRLGTVAGEPLALLEQYFSDRAAGRRSENGVCVWLDAEKRCCRFYDLRPSTCRVFELDSTACRLIRQRHAIETPSRSGPG